MKKSIVITTCIIVILVASISLLERSPKPRSSPATFSTYTDEEFGFSVHYNPLQLSFKENFTTDSISHSKFCTTRDPVSGIVVEEYLTSEISNDKNCRPLKSFNEFINYIAPRGVYTELESASRTKIIITHLQTSVSGAFDGRSTTADTYRIFVEAPQGKDFYALDFYLVPRKGTLSCDDGTCDIGEEKIDGLSYCETDCPNGKDWTKTLTQTFSTLTFLP
ncbi:MAG: hypothetical protein NUV53_02710 [Patescibacteria group bacterium]|nr:hypothetical protein [Patescibacteria group bacterium]